MHDKRELPVLWHQALLVFVQRYKSDLSVEQRETLHDLLRVSVNNSAVIFCVIFYYCIFKTIRISCIAIVFLFI